MNQLTQTPRPSMGSEVATGAVTSLYGTRSVVPRSATPTRTTNNPPVDPDAALDVCEQITRVHAPSLYAELKLLPAYRRRALCAICAFVHRVNEIATSDLHPVEKLELLARARETIPRAGSVRPTEPVLVALRDTHRRFNLPLERLDRLIDGLNAIACEATYETFQDLVTHGRLVAGSVGRLAVAVLRSRDPDAAASLADDLAVAIWLSQILNDGEGGHASGQGAPTFHRDRLARTRELFDRGLDITAFLDARAAAFVNAIAGSYSRLLDRREVEIERIEQREWIAPRDELDDISITDTGSRWSRVPQPVASLTCAHGCWWPVMGSGHFV